MIASNPFGLTKANDLNDSQIQSLWVDVDESGGSSLLSRARPASAMPMFILGGKGSGKTHLMRYCSYPIQKLRYAASNVGVVEGLAQSGYLGIFLRCSGLDANRFAGKGQSTEAWSELFSYYVELWIGQALLRLVPEFLHDAPKDFEERFCVRASSLFDIDTPIIDTVAGFISYVERLQKTLDYQINNAAFTRTLEPEVRLTRGRFVFGLPKIISEEIPAFVNLTFSYLLDEFENLQQDQQRHINTLVREREAPATFKIGGRSFGIKTRRTFSGDEDIIKDSEFEELRLDEQFRQDLVRYRALAKRLVQRRLDDARKYGNPGVGSQRATDVGLDFEQPQYDGKGDFFRKIIGKIPSAERQHMRRLKQKLNEALTSSTLPGIDNQGDLTKILTLVAVEDNPLLERLNVLLIYNAWAKRKDLLLISRQLAVETKRHMSGNTKSSYAAKLSHFKSDIVAQLLRENDKPQTYTGLDTFIEMSEGQPRALLTLLKQVYDWADFEGEVPFERGSVSIDAQRKGAIGAAEWFYSSMTKAGRDGRDILTVVDRLAELFRINRFADNPRECSLIGFSGVIHEVNERAQEVLRLASERSFLVEIQGGQSDRNSERITSKYQLNRMLVPRWRLPTGRRGIVPLSRRELEAIFDPTQTEDFSALRDDWEGRMNAPFPSRRGMWRDLEGFELVPAARQSDLFG